MSLLGDTLTLYKREMLIFKANIRSNLIRSIIFPIVIIVFFGSINMLPSNVPIAVVNLANNPQSISLLSQLSSSRSLQISTVTTESTALSELQAGQVPVVVIILPTFPHSSPNAPGVQIYYSNTQQTASQVGVSAVETIVTAFGAKVSKSLTSAVPSATTSPEVVAGALYGTSSSYKTFLAGGVIPMVVIFGALFGGGMSLISDRQMGNLKAFFITPIKKDAIVLSRIMSGVTQGLIFALAALLIGVADGASIAMSIPLATLYIFGTVVFISASFSCMSIILASKIKNVTSFAIFAQTLNLPLWFISGGITPIQSLPGWLQSFAAFDPLTYANNVIRNVMIQGSLSTSAVMLNFSVLIAFALVCIIISFQVFKTSSGVD